MKEEVLAFIDYMNSEIKERPQCLLFALYLKCKFSNAVILTNVGHTITSIDGTCYDWDGVVKRTDDFLEFPAMYGDSHIVDHHYAMKEIFRR